MTFGSELRRERKARGMNQVALVEALMAAGAGAQQSTISEWERDERRPTWAQWRALVLVMDWAPERSDELLRLGGPPDAAEGAAP